VSLDGLPGTQRIVAVELNVDWRSGGNYYEMVSRPLLTIKGWTLSSDKDKTAALEK
jgi:hypothetical protein